MKTAVVEVGGLLSVLSAQGVQKRLQKLRGVHHAEVNYVAQSATVPYDELTRLGRI
jgi:Cu2+-exporting ATPase